MLMLYVGFSGLFMQAFDRRVYTATSDAAGRV
jgi:hypothetical protein